MNSCHWHLYCQSVIGMVFQAHHLCHAYIARRQHKMWLLNVEGLGTLDNLSPIFTQLSFPSQFPNYCNNHFMPGSVCPSHRCTEQQAGPFRKVPASCCNGHGFSQRLRSLKAILSKYGCRMQLFTLILYI